MMRIAELNRLNDRLLELFDDSQALMGHCDRQRPDPTAAAITVASAGRAVRLVATDFACSLELDPRTLCASRLIELAASCNIPYRCMIGGDAQDARPLTWRELCVAEAEHRTLCGPDLHQATLAERLRHYAIKIATTVGLIGLSYDKVKPDWEQMLLPALGDLFLLGASLANDAREDLPHRAIPKTRRELEAALAEGVFGEAGQA